jgi:hypothetical protein
MKLFIKDNDTAILIGQDVDPTPTGYTDHTNLLEVATNERLSRQMEYNQRRTWVNVLFLAKGVDVAAAFTACTTDEKLQVCKFILIDYTTRLLFYTDEDDKVHWDELVHRSEGEPWATYEGRKRVYEDLRVCVADYVRREVWVPGDYQANLSKSQELFRDVSTYKDWYVGANDPTFKEFLSSTGQFDANTGMKSKDYWLQDLEDDLLEIYNCG